MKPVLCSILAICLAGAPALAQAQATSAELTVRLRDRDGLPVQSALVQLLGPTRTLVAETRSDESGNASIAGLTRGTYELRISDPLYTDIFRVVELHEQSLIVELELRPTGVEERVTVTASRGGVQLESEVPATVRILDRAELQLRAVDLLPRMLEEEPGILTQQTTPGQGSPILRGQSAQAVLYLLDGIRYNNATYRAGNTQYLAWIPDIAVDSVETQLGPAGVNYGSDALGGAVNVISNPTPTHVDDRTRVNGSVRAYGQSATLGGGLHGTLGIGGRELSGYLALSGAGHGDVRGGGARDSHHSTVRFLGFSDDQVRDAFGTRYVDTSYSQLGLTSKLALKTSSTANLNAFLAASRQYDVRRYDRLLGGDGRVRADFEPQKLLFGYLRYERFFSDTFFDVTVSLNRQTDGRFDQRRPTSSLRQEDNADTALGLETAASKSFGRHLVTGGVEIYDEHVDSMQFETSGGVTEQVRPRSPNGSRYTSFGLFLLDDFSAASDRLKVQVGARYSAFSFRARAADNIIDGKAVVPDQDESFDDLTFNLGATFGITEDIGVWGRLARGFRAPSVFDFGETGLTGGGFEVAPGEAVGIGARIGDSAARNALATGIAWTPLKPEVLWSYEAGLRVFADTIRFELTGFVSRFQEAISRRVMIVPGDVVGQSIGGEVIIAQDSEGRIFVASDPDPIVSRANIGSLRVWGLEMLAQRAFGSSWLATLKAALQRGKELDTGFFARKIAPDNMTAVLRWRAPGARFWIEGLARSALEQDRLNPGDIEDTRIGAFRDAGDIADFFNNQGPRLGLVQDGVLLATGESLDEVVARVLGPEGAGAPLFLATPGWLSFTLRGAWEVRDNQHLTVAINNITDRSYRMHGSGFDALGFSAGVSYTVDF